MDVFVIVAIGIAIFFIAFFAGIEVASRATGARRAACNFFSTKHQALPGR